MKVFNLTLTQMLMMFTIMIVGFALRKKKIIPDNSGIVISKLETFFFVPTLNLYNQLINCNVKTFTENSRLILYGLAVIIPAMILATLVSRLFVPKASGEAKRTYQRNIYKYALTFGNYGFIGNFIVLGIWGEEMFFKYTMFTFVIALVCSSWGLYILIPKDENSPSLWANLKKGLTAPPMLALGLGIVMGLLNLTQYVPDFLMSVLSNAKSCMGPCAMLLAGIVIGGYNFKGLLTNKKVYMVSVLRLIVIPGVIALVLKAIGTSSEIVTLALIAFATPLGMNTIVYPAAYGGDTETGASMTMISSTLSVITIPLMYLLFVVLL